MFHGPYDNVQKGSEHRLCQVTKGKWKEEHFGSLSSTFSTRFSTLQQQVITLAEVLDNGYAFWSCWIIVGCRSEMLFLSFSFLIWQWRCFDPFLYLLTTVVWPMMMECFDVMFSWDSVYKNRKTMTIEPWMSVLKIVVVWSDSWRRM